MKNTILSIYLKALGIKFTRYYADKLYTDHPYRGSLYGLSQMLFLYNIPNSGMRNFDKDIGEMEFPFIAYVDKDFYVVSKKSADLLLLQSQDKIEQQTIELFKEKWSGIALLGHLDKESRESHYLLHLFQSLFYSLRSYLLTVLCIIGICSLFVWGSHEYLSALILNTFGLYISFLLLLKQNRIESKQANRICSMFNQKSCNRVLDLEVSKIGGILSWSEIGAGYFISNVLLLLFAPNFYSSLFFINLFALPYTLWSVWYQKFKVKQWCVLCLIVQTIFWLIFLSGILIEPVKFKDISIDHIILILFIYLCITLLVNLIEEKVKEHIDSIMEIRGLKSIKYESDVFVSLLKKQPFYKTDGCMSRIIFGNPDAKLKITVLTNPHCGPCAALHKQVDEMLEKAGNKFCLQYVFLAFNSVLVISNRFLIAAYLKYGTEGVHRIYSDWFEKGKYSYEEYIGKYSLELDAPEINEEILNHDTWKEYHDLTATPTVLINGYKLPVQYSISDLIYFTDISI